MTDDVATQDPVPAVTSLVLPHTGEIIDLTDARQCAEADAALKALKGQIDSLRRELVDAIVRVKEHRGGLDGLGVTLAQGENLDWNMDILKELREAGLPEERWDELVSVVVSTRVDGRVAARIGKANPVYQAIIDRACTRTPKAPTVGLSR